jgi:hypothetical protein
VEMEKRMYIKGEYNEGKGRKTIERCPFYAKFALKTT